ncbi:MAG: DNA polymerase III subunit beta [Candidatus Paceibacterota bacterium]
MKFIILLENLKKGIDLAEKIAGKNFTLPILNNILLKTSKNKLHILSTDLEVGIEVILSGKNEENQDEEIVVPSKIFSNFLHNLSEEKIILETKNQILKVKGGKYEAEFSLLNPEDFPIIPKTKTSKSFEVNKEELKDALERVIPAINPNISRVEISGIYFLIENNILKIVGTDSFRLAEKTITLNNHYEEKTEFILPVKVGLELIQLIQLAPEEDLNHENILIYPESNQVQFNLGNSRIISQIINGEYPPYQTIVPQNFENSVILEKKETLEAIKVIGLFSGKINDILINLNPEKKEVVLMAQDQTFGKSKTSLKAKEISGNHLAISFDYRFLIDGIRNINDDFIFLGFNKENNPALIKGEKEKNFLYVVMPIKL